MAYVLLDGNEAIVLAAIRAGCQFFAGYPITPATSILAKMLELLPAQGGVCLQGEDEISSIGFCLGASMAGKKSMTATSGPGISLCSEQISFAIGSEIPLVLVNVQRLGPSTGSATRGADGDINFMRWGNSGGLPVIVLAPVDVKDCYQLTIHAFNLAEKYRCPVFLASNKEVALTRESIDLDNVAIPSVENRKQFIGTADFFPFQTDDRSNVPAFLPIGSETLVRQTSSTHGRDGYITTDRKEIAAQRQRLKEKLENKVEDYTYYDYFPNEAARILIITYGVTGRAAREAAKLSVEEGVSVLVLKTLWPVPERMISKIAASYGAVLVVEMNLGQYVHEIERVLKDKKVLFYGQMDGSLIAPEKIREALSHV